VTPSKRNKGVPKLGLSIWKRGRKGFTANKSDIFAAIEKSGKSQKEIARRMGAGISRLNDLIDGVELDLWSAYFVDCALSPERPSKPAHSYPPDA
jgi:hypothetical protein